MTKCAEFTKLHANNIDEFEFVFPPIAPMQVLSKDKKKILTSTEVKSVHGCFNTDVDMNLVFQRTRDSPGVNTWTSAAFNAIKGIESVLFLVTDGRQKLAVEGSEEKMVTVHGPWIRSFF